MTPRAGHLDPELLEALAALGVGPDAAPSAASWGPCLEAISEVLRLREEEVEARSHRVIGRLSDEARSAERVFESFLGTMSHELRTPIAVIVGCLELLDAGGLDGERRGTLTTGKQAALDLIRTIDDILDYCRAEAGELGIVRRPFDLEPLLVDVLARHQRQADASAVALELRVDGRLPKRVAGDAHRIEQVLDVLVDNALKFTREGFVRVSLRLEGTPGEGELTLRCAVLDSGPGLPRGALERIFAPFQQLDDSLSRRHGGIGLGLSLAQKLVGAMGGQLEVSSAPGRGSEFSFTVPLQRVESSPAPARGPRPCRRSSPRLLVAEDNDFNRSFITRSLELLGCVVRAVPNGRAALEAIGGFEPDLVLLDVQMPELDGLATAREIRALREPFASLPILALSANAQHVDRARCEDAGMDALLAKPVSMDTLRRTLEHWLELSFPGSAGQPAQPAQPDAPTLPRAAFAPPQDLDRSPLEKLAAPAELAPEELVAPEEPEEPAPLTVPASDGVSSPSSDSSRRTEPNADSGGPNGQSVAVALGSGTVSGASLATVLASASGILDLERIEELVQQAGSVAILRELSAIFLADMGVRLEGLSEAVSAGDRELVRRLAHAVKGSSANFGALEMAQFAERIEQEVGDGPRTSDLRDLQRAFVEVRRVLEEVVLGEEASNACAR